jgi:hypothetical protein
MPGVANTVEKEHGNACRVSLLDIGKLEAFREPREFDGRYHLFSFLCYIVRNPVPELANVAQEARRERAVGVCKGLDFRVLR